MCLYFIPNFIGIGNNGFRNGGFIIRPVIEWPVYIIRHLLVQIPFSGHRLVQHRQIKETSAWMSLLFGENRGGFEPRALRNVPGARFNPRRPSPQRRSSPTTGTSSKQPLMAQITALRRGFFAGRGCFSLPNRTHFVGLRFGFKCWPETGSIYTVSMLHNIPTL